MDDQQIRDSCKNKSYYALSTARIFTLRMQKLDRLLKFNTCLGILVPSLLGGIFATYGNVEVVKIFVSITGILGLVQIVLSVLSLVYTWEENKAYYLESSKVNRRIYEAYKNAMLLCGEELIKSHSEVMELDAKQNDSDDKFPFSNKEEQKGNRYAYYVMRECCEICEAGITEYKLPKLKKGEIRCANCGTTKSTI